VNNTIFTVILGIYTIFILWGIYHYEGKIAKLNRELDALDSDYDTYLLDMDNTALKAQIKQLKAENVALRNVSNPAIWSVRPVIDSAVYVAGESKDMHYESSVYQSGQYESNSSIYANYAELELEPYNQDELDFEQ